VVAVRVTRVLGAHQHRQLARHRRRYAVGVVRAGAVVERLALQSVAGTAENDGRVLPRLALAGGVDVELEVGRSRRVRVVRQDAEPVRRLAEGAGYPAGRQRIARLTVGEAADEGCDAGAELVEVARDGRVHV